MVVRAQRGRLVEREESAPKDSSTGDDWKDREEEDFPAREMRPVSEGSTNPDELIMVMMPRVSWDAFQKLAAKHGGSAAQAMSAALKLLEKSLEKVEKAEVKK